MLGLLFVSAVSAGSVLPTPVSDDPYTNAGPQHRTQVEPDSFAFGQTIVTTSQPGRFAGGGASNNVFATSQNGGRTWVTGGLPGTTVDEGGTWPRISDPWFAYDPEHGVWLALGLGINSSGLGFVLLVNRSTDGGLTWSNPVVAAQSPGTSAEVDGGGRVYVVWHDCQFLTSCSSNDIVMSTSTDGVAWTPKTRIPIDPVNSTVDHFLPGIGAARATSGSTAHLGLGYYYYPVSNCGGSCQLTSGFVSSLDGGATWSAPTKVSGAMDPLWIANTNQGDMVGDYTSTSFTSDGKAHTVFTFAKSLRWGGRPATRRTPAAISGWRRRPSTSPRRSGPWRAFAWTRFGTCRPGVLRTPSSTRPRTSGF